MAVNASPMYQKAEERYRCAATAAERVAALEDMLRLVPKHKASEKLQSALKQKLKAAREDEQRGHGKKGATRDLFQVPRQGAGQVVLLGEANVGKSAIVAALTNAKVDVQPFPHSTHAALPGMAHHEDVPIQFVDMPPVIAGHMEPGMMGAYRSADAILLVLDLSAIDLLDQYERPLALLTERGLTGVSTSDLKFDEDETAAIPKRMLVAANKCDAAGAMDNYEGLKDLCGGSLEIIPVSAQTGSGLADMVRRLYELLNVVRIYAKKPGKPVDHTSPFILPAGGTVHDMAMLVHRELAEHLKTARVWGQNVRDGQQVHHTHVLGDRDVVELHF